MLERNAEIFWKSLNGGADPESVLLIDSNETDYIFEVTHKGAKSYVVGQSTPRGLIWRLPDETENEFIATDVVDVSNEGESTS